MPRRPARALRTAQNGPSGPCARALVSGPTCGLTRAHRDSPAQAATWAWDGKALTRLGHFRSEGYRLIPVVHQHRTTIRALRSNKKRADDRLPYNPSAHFDSAPFLISRRTPRQQWWPFSAARRRRPRRWLPVRLFPCSSPSPFFLSAYTAVEWSHRDQRSPEEGDGAATTPLAGAHVRPEPRVVPLEPAQPMSSAWRSSHAPSRQQRVLFPARGESSHR
jgi:hypothetical protein